MIRCKPSSKPISISIRLLVYWMRSMGLDRKPEAQRSPLLQPLGTCKLYGREEWGGRAAYSPPSAPQCRPSGESAAAARQQPEVEKSCMVHMTSIALAREVLVTGSCMRDILSYCLDRARS